MNYLFLLTVLLLLLLLIVLRGCCISDTNNKQLKIKYQEVIEDNRRLRRTCDDLRNSIKQITKTAEKNRELYLNAIELYNVSMEKHKETIEDLDYAKAIISGDLSNIN